MIDILYNDNELEKELENWLKKHNSVIDILNNNKALFLKLDSQILEDVNIESNVTINGFVHIGRGTTIHSNVVIDGPVIIGENVTINSHAHLRNHVFLGSDCVVGHASDIKNSICLNKSKIQDFTFLGDSIIGVGARIGSGTIVANRKFNQSLIDYKTFDGNKKSSNRDFFGAIIGTYSRIGANCTLMPGTIIGQHTWVLPGCTLHGTYESDLLIKLPKQKLDMVKKNRIILKK